MTPSFSLSKGKPYYYYRCVTNNDKSKKACRIGSVNSVQLENLVVDELKFLASKPKLIEEVVYSATKEQKETAKYLQIMKKGLQDKLDRADRKAKNLLDVLSSGSGKKTESGYIVKELNALEEESGQIKKELDRLDFEITSIESRIVSAEVIRDNFRVFKDVFDNLTDNEKYDLMHLLIKKVVYAEDIPNKGASKQTGKIKMDLWELPPIDPSSITKSAKGFAERPIWLLTAFKVCPQVKINLFLDLVYLLV